MNSYQRNKIERAYGKYAVQHEKVPMYAECYIWFKDERVKDRHLRIFKLSREIDKLDDRIFFYCDGLRGLIELLEGKEDFVIKSFGGFLEEIF